MSKQKRENRRIIRIKLDEPIKVMLSSIGSEVKYTMETFDVSYTGFFLSFEKPGRFPFTASSIMEIWLELEKDKPIFFNGKMARIVYPNDPIASDTGPGIGIRIIQIEKDFEQALKDFVDKHHEMKKDDDNVA